jgi:hypothetical protein
MAPASTSALREFLVGGPRPRRGHPTSQVEGSTPAGRTGGRRARKVTAKPPMKSEATEDAGSNMAVATEEAAPSGEAPDTKPAKKAT